MDIDEQIKLLEEQVGIIRGLRNLNHLDSRFGSWKKTTLNHLENIFSEGSEYVRRFENLTFQEPRFGATGGSKTSYEDMGSFAYDLDRAKTILEDGIEALRRLRPPKTTAETAPNGPRPDTSPPEEAAADDLFFEKAVLEKALSEEPMGETKPEENVTMRQKVPETSFEESERSLEEVITTSQEGNKPSLRNQTVEEVIRYVSSLLYHYVSLEENPKTRKALQGLRAELENPRRSKERIVPALRASWEEGKDILVDIIARVFARKE